MPRLSIIIPVLGDPIQLENTLVSVLENIPADTEVVVALNQPYDDPYNLKDEVQFVLAPPRSGLGGVLNAALDRCDGSIVHLLLAGAEVGPNWTESVLPLFDDPEVAIVAPLVVEKDDPDRIAAAGIDYAAGGSLRRLGARKSVSRGVGRLRPPLGADIVAGFYRRAALEAVGGFAPGVADELASLDVALRLKRAGFRCVFDPQCNVFVQPASLPQPSAFARGYGREKFFWRWAPSSGWKRSLLLHALTLSGACLSCLARPSNVMDVFGRFCASLSPWTHRQHWQSLQETPAAAVRGGVARPHFAARTEAACEAETPSMS